MDSRRLHISIRRFAVGLGIATAAYLVLIAGTGWALNHSHRLRLSEHHISRIWLSASYEPQAGGYEVPLDVIVRDLNAGLLFSRTGAWVLDTFMGLWLITAGAFGGARLATIRRQKQRGSSVAAAPMNHVLPKAVPYGGSRQRASRGKVLPFRKW
jgi:hypothetical protein